jgi:hypothetical protein
LVFGGIQLSGVFKASYFHQKEEKSIEIIKNKSQPEKESGGSSSDETFFLFDRKRTFLMERDWTRNKS